MKPYSNYSAEELLCDDDFLKWVKYPDRYPHLKKFWENWLCENEQKREVVEQARCMILAIATENEYVLSQGRVADIWKKIERSAQLTHKKQHSFWLGWFSKAAVVLLVMAIGWAASRNEAHSPLMLVNDHSGQHYIRYVNNSDVPKTIILSDGTSVVLQPQSVLDYPKAFKPNVREVFLTGQAFFEVTRDPEKPFMVRSNEIVTRVLGTRFTVRNFEGEGEVLVQVKQGKVSVFRASMEKRLSENENPVEGVILAPNQQVLYERDKMKLTKSLVENPSVLIPLAEEKFEFVDAPIKEVFATIEQAYGVEIVFDEEAFSSCYLNASLSDVPLYDKLKLICKGINTTYEIMDSHIIIYGKGCSDDITNQTPI
jgi:transmembrane sensor